MYATKKCGDRAGGSWGKQSGGFNSCRAVDRGGKYEGRTGEKGDRQSYGAIFDEREIVLLQGVSMVRE